MKMRMLYCDIVDGSLLTEAWREHVGPFVSLLRRDCSLNRDPSGNVSIVDAKGIFDTLDRITAGSKTDRRTSIELAICRESLARIGSTIRWVPHPVMPVDPMTKADLAKSNAALFSLLRTGMLNIASEKTSLDERRLDPQSKARSHAASLRQLASQSL